MRWLLLVLALLIAIPGCPPRGPDLFKPRQADAFSAYGAALRDASTFTEELKRLQGTCTAPADPGAVPLGELDAQYELKSQVENGFAALVLTDRFSFEQWTVWFAEDLEGKPDLKLRSELSTSGGYEMELSLAKEKVGLKLVARWVQGRYLQLTRELSISGADLSAAVSAERLHWVVEGPDMPYRILPSSRGPCGVPPFSGEQWQRQAYPGELMLPAAAAYDARHGVLLCVADNHPRLLDRSYEAGVMPGPGGPLRPLLDLSYKVYDPGKDTFADPLLVSGLTLRDSIVLAPITLPEAAPNEEPAETASRAVLDELALLVKAFHFVPKPPAPPAAGPLISASEIDTASSGLDDVLREVTGTWGARLALLNDSGAGPDVRGTTGWDAKGLRGGKSLDAAALARLDRLAKADLALLLENNLSAWPAACSWLKANPRWVAEFTSGQPINSQAALAYPLDIRDPELAAFIPRKLAADLAEYPAAGGYCFAAPPLDLSGQSSTGQQFVASYPAACAALLLRSAEAVHAERPGCLVLQRGLPSLALPACADGYLIEPFGVGAGVKDGEQLPAGGRLAGYAAASIFGAAVYLDSGSCPAQQVLATCSGLNGHLLPSAFRAYPGFAMLAARQMELRQAGGPLRVIYRKPESETASGFQRMVAMLPYDMQGATAMFVAFYGMGGSVEVDETNAIRINWADGSWQGELPAGFWRIEYSDPAKVRPGDVVVILRETLKPMESQGQTIG